MADHATNKRILIVDDEHDILDFIAYNLSKEGFIVSTCQDSLEVINQVQEFKPDLILLDIMMPGKSGLDICKDIRKDPQWNKTLIAFLTARSEDYMHIDALGLGGDDFITKPIKPQVLISRIRALLRRNQELTITGDQVIAIKDLKIDPIQYIVFKDGIGIDLAKKEFMLIYLLASKPGKVFRRDEILKRIWGEEIIVGDRTIDVHIRKVREKVGDHYIRTIKGLGYKFDL
ncbi:MAG: response regulator transcription factor [Bacteroidota bacterium]|nr:response regulator transcription factor [Bacteroidota bacterium]